MISIKDNSLAKIFGFSEEEMKRIQESGQKIIKEIYSSFIENKIPDFSKIAMKMILESRERNLGKVDNKLSKYEKELFMIGISYSLMVDTINKMILFQSQSYDI